MNKWQLALSVLLESDGVPLRPRQISARTGLEPNTCSRTIWSLYDKGRISRTTVIGSQEYLYYLTAEQRARCVTPPNYRVSVRTIAAAIPTRLAFLRKIKTLPAFHGVQVIDAMIADYLEALALERGREDT